MSGRGGSMSLSALYESRLAAEGLDADPYQLAVVEAFQRVMDEAAHPDPDPLPPAGAGDEEMLRVVSRQRACLGLTAL